MEKSRKIRISVYLHTFPNTSHLDAKQIRLHVESDNFDILSEDSSAECQNSQSRTCIETCCGHRQSVP